MFTRFRKEGPEFKLTEMELRRLLGATLETPTRVLRQNLSAYLNAAKTYADDEVARFLRACEDKVLKGKSTNEVEGDSHGGR